MTSPTTEADNHLDHARVVVVVAIDGQGRPGGDLGLFFDEGAARAFQMTIRRRPTMVEEREVPITEIHDAHVGFLSPAQQERREVLLRPSRPAPERVASTVVNNFRTKG
jgi:hypothetical protein